MLTWTLESQRAQEEVALGEDNGTGVLNANGGGWVVRNRPLREPQDPQPYQRVLRSRKSQHC